MGHFIRLRNRNNTQYHCCVCLHGEIDRPGPQVAENCVEVANVPGVGEDVHHAGVAAALQLEPGLHPRAAGEDGAPGRRQEDFLLHEGGLEVWSESEAEVGRTNKTKQILEY